MRTRCKEVVWIYLFLLAVWEPAKYTEFSKWLWVAQIGHQGVAPGKALQEKDSQVSPYRRHNSTKGSRGWKGHFIFLYGVMHLNPGGGQGNPLQYSCLENSMDRSLVSYSL